MSFTMLSASNRHKACPSTSPSINFWANFSNPRKDLRNIPTSDTCERNTVDHTTRDLEEVFQKKPDHTSIPVLQRDLVELFLTHQPLPNFWFLSQQHRYKCVSAKAIKTLQRSFGSQLCSTAFDLMISCTSTC